MDYKGYDLFIGLEDKKLQARNRAVVLWNIFEKYSHQGRASAKGVVEMVGYTKSIPEEERQAAVDMFNSIIDESEKVH